MGNPSETLLIVGRLTVTLHASAIGRYEAAHAALGELMEDFQSFPPEIQPPKGTALRFEIGLECGSVDESGLGPEKPGRRVFRYQDASCYGGGSRRTVVYDDGARVETDHRSGRARIRAGSRERLHEIAYLLILSKAGEALDSRGLHRVHGLGISVQDAGRTSLQASLFLMDSGVGKTTLALSLGRHFKEGEIRFFSDEIPLIDGRAIHPFPIRAAISESALRHLPPEKTGELRPFRRLRYSRKFLLPLSSIGPIAAAEELRNVFICERSDKNGYPRIREASRISVFIRLFRACVVGIGTPQMAEHLLRFDFPHLFRLIRTAFSRLFRCLRLSLRCRAYRFQMGNDPTSNVLAFRDWLTKEFISIHT